MTIDGRRFSLEHDDEKARAGEPHILLSGKVKADQGELPVGLVMTKGADGFVPYQEVDGEVLGTGTGSVAEFSGTLENVPVEPGSVVVTDGVEIFTDDGLGRLVGDAGGSGSIYYNTGAIDATFNTNVGDGTDVEVDYATRVDGVLDELLDTTRNASGRYVRWGLVRREALKVGAVDKAAPDTTLLERMAAKGLFRRLIGIWPVKEHFESKT